MNISKKITFLILQLLSTLAIAQHQNYWQQRADYTMSIDMNVVNYQYNGVQKIVYSNNSPDTLTTVFYHLYFNAFQPGSEMDTRLQHITDPDGRMVNNLGTKESPIYESKIAKLHPDEIGFLKVNSLQQDGKAVQYKTIGTILKVTLGRPVGPGEKTTLEMAFKGQVPLQIRRSGRNNKEGVALSMTQWYPKLAEYDFEGWHADAYIAREFYGVWGDFDVTITIDKNYMLGGTGYLQNPNEIGYGYETAKVKRRKGNKLTWHFTAPNVHDFTWVADPDFKHDKIQGENGVTLHFLYKKDMPAEYLENWKKLQPKTAELLSYYNKHIGRYPYKQYSVLQGGDGGMEYAMCTLITGKRKRNSLIGVTAHEFAHTWFQFLLATNESKHEWMDEGFTSYISDLAMNEIMHQHKENPFERAYKNYVKLATSGMEEPQSLYADRFYYNFAYGASAYSKGEVFLAQLGYIIGQENLQKTLKKYFHDFAFKHPTPNDFIRTAEKVSGLQLDWYLNEWTQTTHYINYAVTDVFKKEITLENRGLMPMPIDLRLTYTDGSTEDFYIPLRMLLGHKPTKATILDDWPWVQPTYTFTVSKPIRTVEIDPKHLMADIDRKNNTFEVND
ncbi:MAG TPA: M1 family peptidase [Flavobacteriia bacterium]|nr:M1 family peptidase [Flavobacteriia bacterium]